MTHGLRLVQRKTLLLYEVLAVATRSQRESRHVIPWRLLVLKSGNYFPQLGSGTYSLGPHILCERQYAGAAHRLSRIYLASTMHRMVLSPLKILNAV